MKKALNLLAIIAFCVIVALGVLFFSDTLKIFLWVKYLFLFSSLIVLLALYTLIGKRTVFDECEYCLKKAAKGIKKLNFNRSNKFLTIKLLNIKNYFAFAIRYLEELQHNYDLYELKILETELKNINEHLSTKNINDIKQNQKYYWDIITNTMKKVANENQKRKNILLKQKELKKRKKNNK